MSAEIGARDCIGASYVRSSRKGKAGPAPADAGQAVTKTVMALHPRPLPTRHAKSGTPPARPRSSRSRAIPCPESEVSRSDKAGQETPQSRACPCVKMWGEQTDGDAHGRVISRAVCWAAAISCNATRGSPLCLTIAEKKRSAGWTTPRRSS